VTITSFKMLKARCIFSTFCACL